MTDRIQAFQAAVKEIGWQDKYASHLYIGEPNEIPPASESQEIVLDPPWTRVQSRDRGEVKIIADFMSLNNALDFSYWDMLKQVERLPRLNQIVDTTNLLDFPEGWERSKAVLLAACDQSGLATDCLAFDDERPRVKGAQSLLLKQEKINGGLSYTVYTVARDKENLVAIFYSRYDSTYFAYCKLKKTLKFDSRPAV